MDKRIIIVITTLLLIRNIGVSQNQTADSISTFYSVLLDSLKANYINRQKIEWEQVEAKVSEQVRAVANFKESLGAVTTLFDNIDCNHCQVFTDDGGHYISSLNTQLTAADFNESFIIELQKQRGFHTKIINENVGYIFMPGMLLLDITQDSLDQVSQKMYDEIVALRSSNDIKGWIIDLRFNIGGNVYPMLAALQSLLGDATVYNTIDLNGDIMTRHFLKDGGFYSGEKLETKVNPSVRPDTTVPVVLLTSKMTASAGEDLAMAFKIRGNACFVGERSYGFLSANDMFDLPFSAQVALTTSYIADAGGIYISHIRPDILVEKQDNFENLMDDGNVIEALKLIERNEK